MKPLGCNEQLIVNNKVNSKVESLLISSRSETKSSVF